MADTLQTYRTITPYLVANDAEAEIRFLQAAFGATESAPEDKPYGHRNAGVIDPNGIS